MRAFLILLSFIFLIVALIAGKTLIDDDDEMAGLGVIQLEILAVQAKLPLMVEPDVRWDSVEAIPPDTFVYNHTLTQVPFSAINQDANLGVIAANARRELIAYGQSHKEFQELARLGANHKFILNSSDARPVIEFTVRRAELLAPAGQR